MKRYARALIAFLFAACWIISGCSNSPSDSGGSPDELDGALVGTWYCIDYTIDGEYDEYGGWFGWENTVWVFRPDGTGTETDNDPGEEPWSEEYTWSTSGGSLTVVSESGQSATSDYHIEGDVLTVTHVDNGHTYIIVMSKSLSPGTYMKTFGGAGFDSGLAMCQTTDGGLILAGYTDSFGEGDDDVLLLKTDLAGNELWSKTLGGAGPEEAYSIQQTDDDGFIIGATTESFGEGGRDAWLIKTDSVGDILWDATYGSSGSDWCTFVEQTEDGGFCIAGTTSGDFWLLQTDSQGTELWSATYGLDIGSGELCFDAFQLDDGDFVLVGSSTQSGVDGRDYCVLRVDAQGSEIWMKTFGGDLEDRAMAVCQLPGQGILVAGYTHSFGVGGADIMLLALDDAGNELWRQLIGTVQNEYCFALNEASDGNFFLAGQGTQEDGEYSDLMITKVAVDGELLWSHIYGGSGHDNAFDLLELGNGGIVIVGTTFVSTVEDFDLLLIRTDHDGLM